MADNKFVAGSFCRKRVIEIYISHHESCLLFIHGFLVAHHFSGGLKDFILEFHYQDIHIYLNKLHKRLIAF